MVKDVATVLLGPAGIWFGWWLNQRSTQILANRVEERASKADERERSLEAARLARRVASGMRDLLHGMYLKGTGNALAQLTDMMDEFNRDRDAFRDAVLALRVLGPSWAVAGTERVDLLASRLTELAFLMQNGLKAEHVDSANKEIPQLDERTSEFIAEVAERYNAAPSALSVPPDYEAEGRWRPLGA